MACVAFPRPVEVRFSGTRIAGYDIFYLVSAAIGGEFNLQMKKLDEVCQLRVGKTRESRHASRCPAIVHHRPDFLPFVVVKHDC